MIYYLTNVNYLTHDVDNILPNILMLMNIKIKHIVVHVHEIKEQSLLLMYIVVVDVY